MSYASNHAPHIRGMFHLFWGLFYWETCLPAFCVSNHLFKLRPHFDRHRVIGYSFAFLRLCCLWPLGSLPVCSRRLALENVTTSFRSHSGHMFPAWTWEDYIICWFFYHFQHWSQVLGSATNCLTGGHQTKLVLHRWTVIRLLSTQWFLPFPVAGCWASPHTPPPFFLSLGFMYFPPKHCFMKRSCSIIFFANLKLS